MDITTKFSLGDRVWVIQGRRAVCKEVTRVSASATLTAQVVVYNVGDNDEPYTEQEMFPTKEELLASL